MGRRKIEIQPILHDRNRSVTFLKRKNGLFKKAYELGVLCSVDVVVIVFGHNQKLYEYSSAPTATTEKIIEKRLNVKRNAGVLTTSALIKLTLTVMRMDWETMIAMTKHSPHSPLDQVVLSNARRPPRHLRLPN
ncbi:hypothetical protein BS47DRAFT_1120279 [Hydnum rufescens UP504]|uniref:MADS-box domain-containing protein n=1 Tax=Hydnum rufescens UP504 TaxID=1448309 RepID=A0A9P6DS98_9AGAM|nr:hypothetical protein BS47DRAFT_1120279 [Hydnum rufescens UP504]